MTWRLLTIGSFVTSSLLSGLCMMPMAQATEMDMHDMASMAGMPSSDCAHCVRQKQPPQPSCDGHCLASATLTDPRATFTAPDVIAPAILDTLVSHPAVTVALDPRIASSPPFVPQDTIVLRL